MFTISRLFNCLINTFCEIVHFISIYTNVNKIKFAYVFSRILGDVIVALKLTNDNGDDIGFRPSSPTSNDQGENTNENENDWIDELNDDDDSAGEDSDDEGLNSKLCTFTQTQKEFMNQHWYHCHTCKMVDGVGVCTVCAKVCHATHDVTYSKHGSFFCDCGAKEDGSCTALVKRSSSAPVRIHDF